MKPRTLRGEYLGQDEGESGGQARWIGPQRLPRRGRGGGGIEHRADGRLAGLSAGEIVGVQERQDRAAALGAEGGALVGGHGAGKGEGGGNCWGWIRRAGSGPSGCLRGRARWRPRRGVLGGGEPRTPHMRRSSGRGPGEGEVVGLQAWTDPVAAVVAGGGALVGGFGRGRDRGQRGDRARWIRSQRMAWGSRQTAAMPWGSWRGGWSLEHHTCGGHAGLGLGLGLSLGEIVGEQERPVRAAALLAGGGAVVGDFGRGRDEGATGDQARWIRSQRLPQGSRQTATTP